MTNFNLFLLNDTLYLSLWQSNKIYHIPLEIFTCLTDDNSAILNIKLFEIKLQNFTRVLLYIFSNCVCYNDFA